MKTPEEWLKSREDFQSENWKGYDVCAWIAAIQSDAVSSERERCAKVCEGMISESMREWASNLTGVLECAAHSIRALAANPAEKDTP